MRTLTSRPSNLSITDKELKRLATPAVNLIQWLSTRITYRDDSQHTMTEAHNMIDEALDCLQLINHVIAAMPSISPYELRYSIAVKVLEDHPYVAFDAVFHIRP